MKKVIIKNKAGVQTHGAQLDDPSEWIAEQASKNSWGKPEREVEESLCSEEEKASALSSRTETDLEGVERTYYTLPATYTIEIIDISTEYELEQVLAKRRAEYPPIEECVEALLESMTEGRPEKLNEIKAKRAAVKTKNPKPT
jgi:hypothetical protein